MGLMKNKNFTYTLRVYALLAVLIGPLLAAVVGFNVSSFRFETVDGAAV